MFCKYCAPSTSRNIISSMFSLLRGVCGKAVVVVLLQEGSGLFLKGWHTLGLKQCAMIGQRQDTQIKDRKIGKALKKTTTLKQKCSLRNPF